MAHAQKRLLDRIGTVFRAAAAKLRPGVRREPTPAPPLRHPWENSYPPSVDWHAEIRTGPVTDILDRAVADFPDRPCLEFMGKAYDYKTVSDLVNRAAKGLQDLGVGPGDCVGLLLPNCPYYIIFYYAVLRVGGTVVNYNPLYAKREIARQIIDSNTRIMVTLNLKTLYPRSRAGFRTGRWSMSSSARCATSCPSRAACCLPSRGGRRSRRSRRTNSMSRTSG